MRYPEQRSLISALLQLDVYYRSARSTPTLSLYIHTYMGDCMAVCAIDDFVQGNISRHASIGMCEYASIWVRYTSACAGIIHRQMLANMCADKSGLWQTRRNDSSALWECFYGQTMCQGREMDMNLLYILGHVSLESTKPMLVMLSGSNGLRIQRL